jgi:hypothetical protein
VPPVEVDDTPAFAPGGFYPGLEPEGRRQALNGNPSRPSTRDDLVALSITVDPPQASLYLDGQPLSYNPTVAFMVKDHRLHTLRGEAAGFESFVSTFQLNLDLAIDATLRPAANVSPYRCEGACLSDGSTQDGIPVAALRTAAP